MCLSQETQHSDASEARTRGPSVSSQALYHWATALPIWAVEISYLVEHKKFNNATWGISSGFAKKKTNFRNRNTSFYRNFDRQPLKIQNGQLHTWRYVWDNPTEWSWRRLTLKAPRKKASENFVCWSRLLQIIAEHYWRIKYRSKQCGPRTDCSYRSSLILVHIVCHRGFFNISADEKSRWLLLSLAH